MFWSQKIGLGGSPKWLDNQIDGLVQDCSISTANALAILQSCTKRLNAVLIQSARIERLQHCLKSYWKTFCEMLHILYMYILVSFLHIWFTTLLLCLEILMQFDIGWCKRWDCIYKWWRQLLKCGGGVGPCGLNMLMPEENGINFRRF